MDTLSAVAVVLTLGLTLPLASSYALWRFAGRPARLRRKHLGAPFLAGALTSITVYGHAGPLPVALMLVWGVNGQYLPWLAWVVGVGALCVLFTVALARRTASE